MCVYVCVCTTTCRIMLRVQTHLRNDKRRMLLSRATHTFITYSHKMHHMCVCVCGHTQDAASMVLCWIFFSYSKCLWVCGNAGLDMGVRCETDPSLCRKRKTHSNLYKKDTFESLQQRHIQISTTKTHSSLYNTDTFESLQQRHIRISPS
jgi:hypothetical protein